MIRSLTLSASFVAVAAMAPAGMANGWQDLVNAPGFTPSTMFLLMDGRVLVNEYLTAHWWILTPDANGSYLNGTWSQTADAFDDRLEFASGVLPDGRVILAGGEASQSGGTETNKCEIYDPVKNKWKSISPPSGWDHIGDAPSVVLADGRFMIGCVADPRTAIYDAVSNTWTATAPGPDGRGNAEQTWTLLPDGTVLTEECYGAPATDLYDPINDVWVALGDTPDNLVDAHEIGPGMMIYTGEAFQVGATPHSARYTPSTTYAGVGTWVDGGQPPIIGSMRPVAADAPASILPSGNVLCALGPATRSPTYFCEYDGTQFFQVSSSRNSSGTTREGRMLPLPTGEVLFASEGVSGVIALYTADGGPDPAWRPTITSMATDLMPGQTYGLSGTQLNGLTTGNAYGDECGVATNYPIVRLHYTNTNHVVYCRCHDRSSMAIATGTTLLSTRVDVPAGAELGPADLEVVANGIASDPIAVIVRDPIVIDFDALATGIVVNTQFAEATFSSSAGFENWTVAGKAGTSLPNVIRTGTSGGATDGLHDTYVDFRCPVSSLSFKAAGVDDVGPVATVNVFESGGSSNTVTIEGPGRLGTPVVVDLTAYQNVTRIEIVGITDTNGIAWDDFEFCLGSSAAWSNYGTGYPGTLGIPAFTAQSRPVLGSSLTLDLANSSASYAVGLVLVGYQQATIHSAWGGDLLLIPANANLIGMSPYGTAITNSLPTDDALCGFEIDLQALEADPGATKGVSFTQGLELVLGH
jgi:hypothetical protein